MASRSQLTISQLSARSGAAPSALRYYEQLGLIQAERTAGQQRRYPPHMLRRVAFIRAGRQLGLSLSDIGVALARLPSGKAPTRADWSRAARTWEKGIDARIAELERLKFDPVELHRLRLPVAAAVRPVQPGGHGGAARTRCALAARG